MSSHINGAAEVLIESNVFGILDYEAEIAGAYHRDMDGKKPDEMVGPNPSPLGPYWAAIIGQTATDWSMCQTVANTLARVLNGPTVITRFLPAHPRMGFPIAVVIFPFESQALSNWIADYDPEQELIPVGMATPRFAIGRR